MEASELPRLGSKLSAQNARKTVLTSTEDFPVNSDDIGDGELDSSEDGKRRRLELFNITFDVI